MTKIESLLSDLKKAAARFEQARRLPVSEINRDATIKRFEFCFELAWKLMQAILQANGVEAYGPKGAIREAAKLGLIDNPEIWLEFLQARNLTTHTYGENLAEKIYKKTVSFDDVVKSFLAKTKEFV
jgi:nucleotidyltransferase substrate binding protein (TIGR01987 family)